MNLLQYLQEYRSAIVKIDNRESEQAQYLEQKKYQESELSEYQEREKMMTTQKNGAIISSKRSLFWFSKL